MNHHCIDRFCTMNTLINSLSVFKVISFKLLNYQSVDELA